VLKNLNIGTEGIICHKFGGKKNTHTAMCTGRVASVRLEIKSDF